MKRNLFSVLAIVLMLLMLPTSTVLAANGDMSITALNDVHGGAGPFLRKVTLQGFRYIGALAEENAQKAEEGILKEGKLLYETYVPALDEELSAYRENALGEISYAYFDRFVLHEYYSNSEGKLKLFFDGGNCIGLQGQLFCRENFYWNGDYEGYDSAERRLYCEYYELQGLKYFSYAEDGKDKSRIDPPLFMCMKDMERLHTVASEEDIPYTVYMASGAEEVYDYVPREDERRELILIDGKLYRIDREEQTLYLLSEKNALQDAVFINWMQDLGLKCQGEGVNHVLAEELEAYLPENYSVHEYTLETADINGDGIWDVLAQLRYEGDDDRFADRYYHWDLWCFMGLPGGGYEVRCIFPDVNGDWSLLGIHGFTGGFILEYYQGHGVHEDLLQHYIYNEAEDDFVYNGYTSNEPGVWEDGYMKFDSSQLGEYSLSFRAYVEENYGKFFYTSERLPSLSDEVLAEKINLTLAGEADKFFAARHNWHLTGLSLAFANSRVLVFNMEQYYDTVKKHRIIPITVDFRTGEIVDYRDYLSPEEFGKLFYDLFTDEEITAWDAAALYAAYDDYDKLMSIKEDSLTVRLTQEGLLLYISTEDTVWPEERLIPRSSLIDTALAAFWDDWPGEMY